MAGSETHYTLPLPVFDKPVKLLIVVAPYYKDIADNLVAGARAVAAACGAEVELVEVPGALEVPTAIAMAERHGEVRRLCRAGLRDPGRDHALRHGLQ
jgi:6,7-dimethyl-8-ribityllumazine synthase